MISHRHQCIFVHIPKTAGNSINRVFDIGWEDHKDLQRYHDEVSPELFQRYFKFAVVRNPWDRLLSDYNYQRKKSREKDSKLFVFTEGGSKRNFAEWVEVALHNPERYESESWGGTVSSHIHRWSPQIDWISVEGQPRVDFVARLERLPFDFRRICDRLGLPPVRLPHRNRRLHWHYSHYYDRATRDLVAAYYARDIEYFGYEFKESLLRFRLRGAASPRARRPMASASAAHSPASIVRTVRSVHSWTQSSYALLVATLALFIGAWKSPSATKPMGREEARDSVGAAVQDTFGRVLVRSGNQSASGIPLTPFAQFRRLARTTPGLHFNTDLLLPASLGLAPILEVEAPSRRSPSASWPVNTPDNPGVSRGRGWFARHGQDS